MRSSRGSAAGSREKGTARASVVMSRVSECSIRKSGFSVQSPRSFDNRRELKNRPDSGSVRPGPLARLVATAGRMPWFQIRSAQPLHRSWDPSWPRAAASRAAALRPATTQAFEYRNAPKCWSRLPAELIRCRSSSSRNPGWPPESPQQTLQACSIMGQTEATKSRSPVRR